MVRCPNCGRKTESEYCQWCGYPVLRHGLKKRGKSEKRARKEAELQAKEQARKEAEEARKAKEAEEMAKKEAERQAKEQARMEAEEARKPSEAEEKAKKEAEEVQQAVRDIYEGNFQLVVPSPVSFQQVRQFAERLERVENLKIVWLGGSMDEGTIIGISVEKPMTLIRILNEVPMVEKVDKKGEKIIVMLETSTVS